MSGHSKWHQIKHQKGAADAKRGKLFSKLVKNISVAARDGKETETNFKLRLAIDKAKSINMPHDTIERAVLRGAGELAGQNQLEEVIYEAYGLAGSAFVIIVNTDNKNRTTAQIRHILSKNGGILAEAGSVMWNFERKGFIQIADYKSQVANLEKFELKMIDLGALDIKQENQTITIYVSLEYLQKIKEELDKDGLKIQSFGLEYVAKNQIELSVNDKEKVLQLIEVLEEEEEVIEVFNNVR